METICGINAVFEALKARKRKVLGVYIAEGRKEGTIAKITDLAEKLSVKVKIVPKGKIFDLTRVETNQGVAAEVESFTYISIEELINLAKKAEKPAFLIILDQINDPHNLGAVIRTAHLLGAHGIILPKDNAAGIGPTVTKAASGAVEYIPIAKVINLNNAINTLKNNNIWVVGADGDTSKNIFDYDFTTPTAIVLGGEGKGIRRLVKENCDELLAIPMVGKVGSFNVSVASAIFMTELVRQRLSKKCAVAA